MHGYAPTWPTFAREWLRARAGLTLVQEVGLAMRAHRYDLGLSQRRYAAHRGWSRAKIGRLEMDAGALKLADVLDALEPTGCRLCLTHTQRPTADDRAVHLAEVLPEHWDKPELLARTRDGRRRFAGHHRTVQVWNPPRWWWFAESTRAGAVEPTWSASRDVAG